MLSQQAGQRYLPIPAALAAPQRLIDLLPGTPGFARHGSRRAARPEARRRVIASAQARIWSTVSSALSFSIPRTSRGADERPATG